MRDPDLVVRAQQAATALESAWRRWRSMHGLEDESMPPVSSYVGYSLDEPWGQARIVFGICAEEAEQLTVLLANHDCIGPVYASVTGGTADHPAHSDPSGGPVSPAPPGVVHVPQPAPASGGQQPVSAGPGLSSRPASPERSRNRELAGATALTGPLEPGPASGGTPIAMAASRAVTAAIASRQESAGLPSSGLPSVLSPGTPSSGAPSHGARSSAGYSAGGAAAVLADAETAVGGIPPLPSDGIAAFRSRGEPAARQGSQPVSSAEQDEDAGWPFADPEPGREGRVAGGPSWSRLKRQGSAADRAPADRAPADRAPAGTSGAPGPDQARTATGAQDSRDRPSSPAATAEAAAWSASELPGQAAISDTAL